MSKPPNFEKVSVSLPPEVHAWLKSEAARRTRRYGEKWTVSRIVQESMREYRERQNATTIITGQAIPDHLIDNEANPPQSGQNVIRPATSAGGSKTPKIHYQKRQAK